MADWYYEYEGSRAGPVDENHIMQLIADGTLKSFSLLWSSEFGPSWKPIEQTSFAPLIPRNISEPPLSGPPPLPGKAVPHNESRQKEEKLNQQTYAEGQTFLASDLTKQIIGKNADFYINKWNVFLQNDSFNLNAVARQRSWNWSAFLIPYAWLIYRKMYGWGAAVIAFLLASSFFGKLSYGAGIGTAVVTGIYGNAWYFRAVYDKWQRVQRIGDTELALKTTAQHQGTNLYGAIGSVVALVVLSALLFGEEGIFSSDLSCSSSATQDLVTQIAREQIPKDGYMMYVVDEKNTKISLSAIRTQATEKTNTRCAATIAYKLAFKGKPGEAEQVRAALEQALNRDITYKVEKTDKGDEIYATVYGLQN